MKKILLIVTVIGILTSCSRKNDLDNLVIDGTFSHQIPDCEFSGNTEENCIEILWFNDDSSANIMFGGSDYGIKLNYNRKGDIIKFASFSETNVTFSFKIESENVLIRIEDNEIWHKEE